jgi:hypothetical protein
LEFSEITAGLSISAFAADDGRRAQVGDVRAIPDQEEHFWAIVVIAPALPSIGLASGYTPEGLTYDRPYDAEYGSAGHRRSNGRQ